jgi:hypothetical protein
VILELPLLLYPITNITEKRGLEHALQWRVKRAASSKLIKRKPFALVSLRAQV